MGKREVNKDDKGGKGQENSVFVPLLEKRAWFYTPPEKR